MFRYFHYYILKIDLLKKEKLDKSKHATFCTIMFLSSLFFSLHSSKKRDEKKEKDSIDLNFAKNI